jgi:glycosyltransferase involved in cell wall biosynthesis
MSAPRVSVILPTYNWSEVLRCSITSALRQSLQDFELLVIGDACTDDSAAVAASFGDPRVRWHNLPRNSGSQAGPNNAGLELARGEYVAYLGHDDVWYPTHLASLTAALDRSGADLAYAVAILYGPRESGVRAVTGLWEPRPEEPLRHIPPSSLMLRREVAARLGPWKDHRTVRLPPDYEFLLRLWEHQGSFVPTRQLSVFKFTAGWRPDAYHVRGCEEQAECLRRIETEPDLRERELLDVIVAYDAGKTVEIGPPPDAPPGDLVERTKTFKGVESELPAAARTDRLRFDFDQVLPGFEWHGVERDSHHGVFQWSGPSTRSSLHLPLVNDRDLTITFGVINALAPDVLESLGLEVNGEPVALSRRSKETHGYRFAGRLPAAALARSLGAPRLTFVVSRTIEPTSLDPASGDRRRLGLAFHDLEVKPAAGR